MPNDEYEEYAQDYPTEEQILNWREANEYVHEGEETEDDYEWCNPDLQLTYQHIDLLNEYLSVPLTKLLAAFVGGCCFGVGLVLIILGARP
jgi:hypothetical protein